VGCAFLFFRDEMISSGGWDVSKGAMTDHFPYTHFTTPRGRGEIIDVIWAFEKMGMWISGGDRGKK
jgi:hypothetical protein